MKRKLVLNSDIKQKILSKNKSIIFDWNGDINKGIIFRNNKIGINLFYYAVLNEENNFVYDTFGIEERENNCVSVVLNQKNEICLLKEYRFMPEKYFFSCPRGISDSNQEESLDCALREVREEVGDFRIIETEDLGNLYQNTTFFLNPISVNMVKIEINEKMEINEDQQSEDIISVDFYKPESVKKMIAEGKIECLITLGALSKYFAHIENI